MRDAIAAVTVAGALTLMPNVGFATTPAPQTQAPSTASQTKASHATTGMVKSVSPTSLVITRSGKPRDEMTFELSASTHREGTVEAGAPVSVRYREEGKSHVATAITVQRPKQQTATHSAAAAK